MPKKSTSKTSTAASKVASHNHNDLIKQIAELEAEVASLKKQFANQGSGGEDERVSKIWAALSAFPKFQRFLK